MASDDVAPARTPVRSVPGAPWMEDAATVRVIEALTADGADVRFVGGCVRDEVLGRPVADIDIATPEPPESVIERIEAAGLKAVPTGLKHGTVTAVAKGRPFEVTTLRRDVETDGRHAVVDFTDDWAEDAARRDFTMNAMSLTPGGDLYDYAGGLADLEAGRVRFMGAAEDRIREDVLRLLRFYRFHAHYGRGAPDADARAACRKLADLLPGLSAERVRVEFLKLLAAPDPAPVIEMMRDDGVLIHVLPDAAKSDLLVSLVDLETVPDPLRRLAALLPMDPDIMAATAERLRLSNAQRDRLAAVAKAAPDFKLPADGPATRRALYVHGAEGFADLVHLTAAGKGDANIAPLLAAAADWMRPKLPVTGQDLIDAGMKKGPAVGKALKKIETRWIDSDFAATHADLLADVKSG